ncbi:ATP-grasp domain-containing protein [Kitasatospora sp. RB6PN24]|uniref:ATP-grasp domain-containing protein n=1 Tax=Kitasatospora humi TaxID=2893891 RepID=UPI001E33F4C9|nr:ATP-grasp domain-containing protein [Kitasatospora humi]MCC9306076.1 ATP-grasp domain-containing protein [Kitasatospora humi]
MTEFHRIDSYDPQVLEALIREVAPDGLLTYDELLVEPVARLAAAVGLPYTDAEAVRRCKDKSALRAVLAEAGLSPVRFAVAATEEDAVRAAEEIGYPVVLKPRALGGSIGVVQVQDEKELLAAFTVAADANSNGIVSAHSGVLIEEYLDGPEYSVDAVTWQGRTTPLVVAEKEIGFPPYFEETGHIVPPAPHPDLAAAVDMVVRAHAVVGLDRLVSHTEFKLTSRGPRIVEINVRLGGDLIPYLGTLSSGVDVAGAAADVAVGQEPDLSTDRSRHAAIGMIYPEHDIRLESVTLGGEADRAGLDQFTTFVPAGTEVRLPPAGFLSRIGLAIVSADTREECQSLLAGVRADVVVEGTPLDSR